MGRHNKRESASAVLRGYNMEITSATQSRADDRTRRHQQEDPQCCCCPATTVLITCNTGLFFLSIAIIMVGFFINNEVSGWQLRLFETLGFLWCAAHVFPQPPALHGSPKHALLQRDAPGFSHRASRSIAVGVFLFVVSILGVMAARTMNRALMFVYFMLNLMVTAALCLSVIYAIVENDTIQSYLTEHWAEVQRVVGVELPDLEIVNKMMHDHFGVLVGVGSAGMFFQVINLVR